MTTGQHNLNFASAITIRAPRPPVFSLPPLAVCALLLPCVPACHDSPPAVTAPLTHRAYVWQREWTPAVSAAVRETRGKLAGHVMLGCEITWQKGEPRPIRANIDWPAIKDCSLALRVASHSVPFDEAATGAILKEAQNLLSAARTNGKTCAELQLDFDCAQKKLAGYRPLVKALRTAIRPTPLVITMLPVWLDEPEFPALIAEADRYVLQVHSVQPAAPGARVAICDPDRARRCVRQADKLGREFEVALPTYSALVGLAPDGKVTGYAFEGATPDWPPGTTRVSCRCEPDEMAGLVREWQTHRPSHLRGVLWFRLPIKTDTRNWTWPQLAAAMEGRPLIHQITARTEGRNPVDLMVVNEGEADDPLPVITATWQGVRLAAAEALPGWSVTVQDQSVRFSPAAVNGENSTGKGLRNLVPSLPPGMRRSIGWLRFDHPADVHVEVVH